MKQLMNTLITTDKAEYRQKHERRSGEQLPGALNPRSSTLRERAGSYVLDEVAEPEQPAVDTVYEQFQWIVQTYDQKLYRFARHLAASRQDAEDLVQETFMRAYNALKTYPREKRETLHVSGWLHTIMKNTNLSSRDRQQLRGSYSATSLDQLGNGTLSEADHTTAVIEVDAIQQALVRVSPQYRTCLTLQDICGLSQKEIALKLPITPGCVGASISRGRLQFRQAYQRVGDETGSQRCPGH